MYLILGSSPNAWFAALRLSETGQSVQVLECASHLGAPFVTQDGVEWGLSDVPFSAPIAERWNLTTSLLRHSGRSLVVDGAHRLRITRQGLSGQVSARDSQRWPDFVSLMEQASDLLRRLSAPSDKDVSDFAERGGSKGEASSPPSIFERWRALGRRQSMEVLRLPWMSLRDLLDEWFEDEGVRGVLAEVGLEGVAAGPFAAGSAFHLLSRWSRGEVLEPATAVGGSSSWIQALRAVSESRGVRVAHVPGQPRLEWVDGEARALEVAGERYEFTHLLVDKDVRWTYGSLVSARVLETEFNGAVRRVRGQGIWQRGWTRAVWPGHWPAEARTDLLHLNSGLRALERCWDEVKRQRIPSQPPVILNWPGLLDASRPQDLLQVAWGYGGGEQAQRWDWLDKQSWTVRTQEQFSQEWQCPQGHLWGGQRDLSQSFFLRPVPEYTTQIPNIDLCSVSTNPADFEGQAGVAAAERLLSTTSVAAG